MGRTFAYGDSGPYGLLSGKPTDFSTPYLTTLLGFLGITTWRRARGSSVAA